MGNHKIVFGSEANPNKCLIPNTNAVIYISDSTRSNNNYKLYKMI